MIDPSKIAFFIPNGLKAFKQTLFNNVGNRIIEHGGRVVKGNLKELGSLPNEIIPVVGCWPTELNSIIDNWRKNNRTWIFWDRGYARRIFATDLPKGENGGYYRWHINSFQLQKIRELPSDRWDSLKTDVYPWQKEGEHIVVAEPTETYAKFHRITDWTSRTVAELKKITKRPLLLRRKEHQTTLNRRLFDDLRGAHCLVTHGSGAAVESAIMGCPVFVHSDSAASLVGLTDLKQIENPIYPDRKLWLNSLAYSQFNEEELVNGTLWDLIT